MLQADGTPLLRQQADSLGQHFARMASRDMAERTPEAEPLQQEFFDPLATACIDAFQQLYPGRPWCYQCTLLHFMTVTRVQRRSGGSATPADPRRQPMLQGFIEAGITGVLGVPGVATATATHPAAPKPRQP